MDRVLVQVKSICLSNGFDCAISIKHAKVDNAKRKRSESAEIDEDNTKAIELVKVSLFVISMIFLEIFLICNTNLDNKNNNTNEFLNTIE